MIEALKMADTKLSDVDSFLATLLAEHDAPGVRAQLQNLWIANVRFINGDEDDALQRRLEERWGLGARGLDAMRPRPRRTARNRPALRVETENQTRRAREMDCKWHWVQHWVPRMAPWARAPGWICMPAARRLIAINTLEQNHVWNSTE